MSLDASMILAGGFFHLVGAYVSFLVTRMFYEKSKENSKFNYAYYGFTLYTVVFAVTGLLFISGHYYENLNYVTHSLRSVAAVFIAVSIIK